MRARSVETLDGGFLTVVPKQSRKIVHFNVKAHQPGNPEFQVIASCGSSTDAVLFTFPVYLSSNKQSTAINGSIHEKNYILSQPIVLPSLDPKYPSDYFFNFITVSPTLVTHLQGAVDYIMDYPYNCSEQLSSTIIVLTAMIKIFKTKGAHEKMFGKYTNFEVKKKVMNSIADLIKRQKESGGFSFWPDSTNINNFVSLYAIQALLYAKSEFSVTSGVLNKAEEFVNKGANGTFEGEKEIHPDGKRALQAFALYLLYTLKGIKPPHKKIAEQLIQGTKDWKIISWLLPIVVTKWPHNTLSSLISNHLFEDISGVHFTTHSEGENALFLHSDFRTTAQILESLLLTSYPQKELISNLTKSILKQQVDGKWTNTQDNAFVIKALERYFTTFEANTNISCKIWANNVELHSTKWSKVDNTRPFEKVTIPLLDIVNESGGHNILTLDKSGPGVLYYGILLQYGQVSMVQKAIDRGFALTRTYESVEDKNNLLLKAKEDYPHYLVQPGSKIKITTTITCTTPRQFVAISIPLPSGFESIFQQTPTTAVGGSTWSWRWYDHCNFRNNRAEIFADYLQPGYYHFSFFVRATMKGEFSVMPARAEQMYKPEVFGCTTSEYISIISN
eukprot:TRINITY_DN3757_c0_g1_i1.p1 TRINITY_DN3757_c0_g1~~TRINITY_DN3757_c0_g1_i1.p1  ORF type:complete len:655 (+),score=133.00 TRINITY_DN3757_c0_g1_i1:113-1966(+)